MLADDFLDGYLNAGDDQASVFFFKAVASAKTLVAIEFGKPEILAFFGSLFLNSLSSFGRRLLLGCPEFCGIGSEILNPW